MDRQKRKVGRPAMAEHLKKVNYGTRLSKSTVAYLRTQRNAAGLIERLVLAHKERKVI